MFTSSFVQKHQQAELAAIASDINSAVRFAKFSAGISGDKLAIECFESGNCSKGSQVVICKSLVGNVMLREWRWPNNRQRIIWRGFQAKSGPRFSGDVRHNAANGKFIIMLGDKIFMELIINRLGKVRLRRSDFHAS